jgi:subtilisin family serine protease
MKSWVKSHARQASSGVRTLAAMVLGPALALQGCTNKEEPQTTTALATKMARASSDLRTLRDANGAEYVAGELLVRFKKNAGVMALAAHRLAGAKVLHTYRAMPELQLVSVDESAMQDAITAYQKDPSVEYVEPNYVYRINGTTPNDALFGQLWGLNNTGQSNGVPDIDINAPEAWDITTGSSTSGVVAVIDTGVDYTHPDLAANMWTNPGEIPGNGLDDDNNGYIDDVHGINAITNSGNPMDDHDHGTHVSGTIAGQGNNGRGVAGVNWTAQILGCKFLDAAGNGTTANAVKCLDYVHVMKTRTVNPVNVIATNNSWGGGSFAQTLLDGIIQQRNDGILFVAAAGNAGANHDTTPSYPSSYFASNVISVASHDRSNNLASDSSYGRRMVHVAAPGVGVMSTVAGGGYAAFNGTSMAAPHVTGVLALLKAQDPSRDWRQLKNLVLAGGVSSAAATGKTLTGKRLRAADTGGQGALTCDNQAFSTRVRPIADTVTVNIYEQVPLVAYHVNCDGPAGVATVTVSPGSQSFNLTDSGVYGDEVAGDGLYTGAFEPTEPGTYTLTFPGGDTLTVTAVQPPQGYVKSSVPMVWRTITGTSLALTDESVANFTSPFPVPFSGGAGQTTVRVGMNGGIKFESTGSIGLTNATLPSASHVTLVAPWWDDLFPGPTSADNVFWAVLGTAPDRELVVEWRNVHHYTTRTGTNTLNFQVVFFEGSSDILFNYRDTLVGNASLDRGASATVGVQSSSTMATLHSFNTASLNDNTAYLWTIPSPSQAPVVDMVTVSETAISEGDTVTVEATFSDPDGATDGPWKVEIDADYPGWFTADITQNATEQGTVSGTATIRVSGDVTVAVRVQDKGGNRSALSQTQITVADVPPTLAAVTTSGPTGERQPVTISTSFTDPGLDSPWKVEWDFDYDGSTFTADAFTRATTPGNVSTVYAFPNDGTYTVAARVTDKDGVMSNIQTVQIAIADLRPALTGIAGNFTLVEGSHYDLEAAFINPGDNSRPWKVQWDFDYDGENFDVDEEEERSVDGPIALSRFARDSGRRTFALRVLDSDGSISDVQTVVMDIEEAHPVLSPLAMQVLAGGSNEPSTVQFELSANSGAEEPSADPIRAFLWDFDGDGIYDYAGTSPYAVFTYRDNKAGGGAYTARVRVLDEDSYSEEEIAVTILNVAPTLTVPEPQEAWAGSLLALRLRATDPGADVLSFSASGAPAGLAVSSDGLLLWTPSRQQGSRLGRQYTVNVTVTDDDGASDTQPITLTIKWLDADNDGMEDTWERENGLDPTNPNDAMDDRDGDGINNGAEFRNAFDGLALPAVATVQSPVTGALVKAPQLTLTTANVANRGDLATVKYEFQLFSGETLANRLCSTTVDEATTGGRTSATLPSAASCPELTLQDDQVYSWRVRATDGDKIQGPWSSVQTFKLSTENDAPGLPRASQPMPGAQIATATPVLTVDNALDVDDTQLTYTFELATDAAMTQDKLSSDAIAGGASGSTSWAVPSALKAFTTYYWRVTVKDPGNLQAVSEVSSFTYLGRPSNREPRVPEAVEPAANGKVSTLTPTLVVKASTDADGDELLYTFEVDTSPTFNSPARKASLSLKAEEDGMVRWQTEGLSEDTQYWWRARAADPYSASDWVLGSFMVNAQNNAPSAPMALNPSDAIIFTRTPTLIVQTSVDPEGDAITYVFEVKAGGTVVSSGEVATAAGSQSNQASFKVTKELEPGTEYVWTARAKDAAGAVSAASADARFQVYKEPVFPEPEKDSGCSTGAGALGGLLPLLAMALGMLRRRRS